MAGRRPRQFAATISVAAEQPGVLPLAVEKDYWVCEALRAINASHPGQIVFKGGTSLEKLRIIRRFSEDLDLLVVGAYPSHRAAERRPCARVIHIEVNRASRGTCPALASRGSAARSRCRSGARRARAVGRSC